MPSTFLFIGIGDAELGSTANLHTPRFRLDEGVLPKGAALHASLALGYLARGVEGFHGSKFKPAERVEL